MTTQTSLVAEQVRLQQWAEQVRDCKNRPRGMDVETWCAQNNITKANYYYRLRRVRKACLDQLQTEQSDFIELPMTSEKNISADTENVSDSVPAIRIKTKEGVSFEVFSNVSSTHTLEVKTHLGWTKENKFVFVEEEERLWEFFLKNAK